MDTAGETGLRRTTFANGLTIVSEFMPHVRSVALGAWVRSASVHEPRELMGISHMLEHMVFKGTQKRTAHQLALALETVGGTLDAWTSREHTAFQARVLDEHLPLAAEVIADLMFAPLLRDSDLELEKKVVLEEIAMVDDAPDDIVFELHNELMWGSDPLGYSILGTRDSVAALPGDALRALHGRAYRPDRVVVAAAGHVEHDALVTVLRDAGWEALTPHGAPVAPVPDAAASASPGRRVHIERDTAQSHVVLGAPAIAWRDERRYAFTILSAVLGGGMSSRLFQRVREERGLAYSIYSYHHHYQSVGMHGVYFATAAEQVDEALASVHGELADVAAHGLPADELAMGKSQLKGQITLSLEGAGARLSRAAATELYGEPYRPLEEVLRRIDRVTADDVAQVAREYFPPAGMTTLTLGQGVAVG